MTKNKHTRRTEELNLINRFNQLKAQTTSLDYAWTIWAKDARQRYPIGDVGDKSFITWCAVKLVASGDEAKQLLLRARAAEALSDESTFNRVGGFSKILKLVDLSKSKQVDVLNRSKTEHKSVNTILREDARKASPEVAKPKTRNSYNDALHLARRLVAVDKNIPEDLHEIVKFYVRKLAPKASLKSVA